MNDTIVGLDLAKNIFHLASINRVGKLIRKKKLQRRQVRQYFTQLERSKIAMEACASAHFWAREFRKMGLKVMPTCMAAMAVVALSAGQCAQSLV